MVCLIAQVQRRHVHRALIKLLHNVSPWIIYISEFLFYIFDFLNIISVFILSNLGDRYEKSQMPRGY